MAYDPLSGEGYTAEEARAVWSSSMQRSGPRWDLRGGPGAWYWHFWGFGTHYGRVTVEADGFHYQVSDYDSGMKLFDGVTQSLAVVYRSVESGAQK